MGRLTIRFVDGHEWSTRFSAEGADTIAETLRKQSQSGWLVITGDEDESAPAGLMAVQPEQVQSIHYAEQR